MWSDDQETYLLRSEKERLQTKIAALERRLTEAERLLSKCATAITGYYYGELDYFSGYAMTRWADEAKAYLSLSAADPVASDRTGPERSPSGD